MGRNIFRDSGFRDMDFSVFKNSPGKSGITLSSGWKSSTSSTTPFQPIRTARRMAPTEETTRQSAAGFGGSTSTPDVAAGNPIVGSGAARDVQVGLKITF